MSSTLLSMFYVSTIVFPMRFIHCHFIPGCHPQSIGRCMFFGVILSLRISLLNSLYVRYFKSSQNFKHTPLKIDNVSSKMGPARVELGWASLSSSLPFGPCGFRGFVLTQFASHAR
jgi:hypothetical protein